MNPYKISGPSVVSFSGGRTSAYMLRKILDAHDGALPQDVHVLFANTGKPRPAPPPMPNIKSIYEKLVGSR